MDQQDNVIEDFEQILQQKKSIKTFGLYKRVLNTNKYIYKPQDVIEKVNSQMKAIQLADRVSSSQSASKNMNIGTKTDFLPINKLPVYNEVPQTNTNKFETQCVSDTQLINIIDEAEVLHSNMGITQEFDTTFDHLEDRLDSKPNKSPGISKNISTADPVKEKVDLDPIWISNNKNNETDTAKENYTDIVRSSQNRMKIDVEEITEMDINSYGKDHISIDKHFDNRAVADITLTQDNSQLFRTASEDTVTFIRTKELKDIFYDSDDLEIDTGQDSQRSPSPVLHMKARKSKTPSPLVVSLETFEHFESIAMNAIVETGELETAKKLVNSQILGKELFLNSYLMERNYSPILELKSDELKISSQDLKSPTANDKVVEVFENATENHSASLKDEILFSSDEENEYIHKEILDLPLTCALETSFNDEPNILDKTMYVGFQTASNKSIQICTGSFNKAKSILVEDKLINDFSVTDLVEKCDDITMNPMKNLSPSESIASEKSFQSQDRTDTNIDSDNSNIFIKEDSKEKQLNVGFTTGEFMKFNISDKAMRKCHEVFKDIDLNKKFEVANCEAESDSKTKTIETTDVPQTNDNMVPHVVESVIDDKINDELLLEEFQNIEMSLEKIDIKTNKSYDIPKNIHENKIDDAKFKSTMTSVGFQTASNKNINLTSEALAKTKDIDFQKDDESSVISQNQPSINSTVLVGFKTANNKEIKITEIAMVNTKNIFKDLDKELPEIDTIENFNKTSDTAWAGFKTANNRNINISKKALSKSENVFKNIDAEQYEKDYICDVNQPSTSKAVFMGFKTGSNKEIRVSEKALAKSNNIFKDIDKEQIIEGTKQPSISKDVFVGFKTGNNKEIKISEKALSRSKNIFKDIGKDKEQLCQDYVKDSIQSPFSKHSYVGIKMGNYEEIEISEKALSRSKNIFKDICKDNLMNTVENVAHTIAGSKTANNDEIQMSKQALSESKSVFKFNDAHLKEIGNNTDIPTTTEDKTTEIQTANTEVSDNSVSKSNEKDKNVYKEIALQNREESAFMGFKTASNKNVIISKDATERSRKLFQDILQDIGAIDDTESEFYPNIEFKEDTEFSGFKTANNKTVNISIEALEKSKKLLADSNSTKNLHDPCNDDINDEFPMFKGFQTANKKIVTVSADAMTKSKRLFEDIDKVENVPPKIQKILKGFQTANSKPVDVSTEALEASKKLFADISGSQIDSNVFLGFKTANNKAVNISKQALAKSIKVFDDIDFNKTPMIGDQLKPDEYDPKIGPFIGFQTGNDKEVEISKDALEQVENIFDDIDYATKPTGFCGFQTASKKSVLVSEQALAKTRHLFKDIDKENNNFNTMQNDFKIYDDKTKSKNVFSFSTGNSKNIAVSEDSLIASKKLLGNDKVIFKTKFLEEKKMNLKDIGENKAINIDNILDTQVLNNFEENLCTEDFNNTPKVYKRSASPILSCPRAKKRKFETPYKNGPINEIKNIIGKPLELNNKEFQKHQDVIKFRSDYKKNKKYTLKDLAKLEKETSNVDKETKSNIDTYFTNFNIENILQFEFDEKRNDLTSGKMTIEQLKLLFTEAANKKIIPDGWLDIQLKLILWKLMSYEIRFPNTLGKVCSVRNVIDQLKYRYDKELYNAERPILRKILEKDDVPTKTMILCVAGIYVDGVYNTSPTAETNIELLLTDGWYFIKATIDKMLSKLVYDRKIVVGRKIATCGAELIGCEQGIAPWEDTSSIRLQISGNSTRPSPPHSALGTKSDKTCALRDVTLSGGRTARLRVCVQRRYPTLTVDKLSTVVRTERQEYLYQMKYEAEREAMIEKIYEEVEKEFMQQESQDSEELSNDNNETGTQIARMMKKSKDPMDFRAQLTNTQSHLLQQHTTKQRDKYLSTVQARIQEKLPAHNVVTVLRLLVADWWRGHLSTAKLSVWKPSDEVLEILQEGAWIEVTNIVPTAMRNSVIQLSAGRQSAFRVIKPKEDPIRKAYLDTLKRIYFTIEHLSQNPTLSSPFNEIDTAGIIFFIDPPNQQFDSNKNQFQNMYLSDTDKNMICVIFWGGISKMGYEHVLDAGQVIYCENLQKRAGNSKKNIPQYRATDQTIFTRTTKNVNGKKLVEELNKKLQGLDKRKFCEDCITVMQHYSVIRRLGDDENVSPFRFNISDFNMSKRKMFIDTPLGVKVNKETKHKQDEFNLTGLDFDSTFKQETQELSPKTLLRKKKVNEKIARLKMYGEPPPLSPINIINKSKNAVNSYKSPLPKGDTAPINESIANVNNCQNDDTPKKLPDINSDVTQSNNRSPIILMNRTYVKRSVNPVKLNFSESVSKKENNSDIDHFADDFDGSPPLSLD